ncbi:hypothetical protein CXB51_004101 [Gossypium anomalum]|uniref:Uncharacterized protein n=1 Tax=Gossypium anomalum TaxID=47600 RepID=A0A8J6DB06_9ROSI|nr:hypothetical protein CXB51_004101 [Gossypium anomalum]
MLRDDQSCNGEYRWRIVHGGQSKKRAHMVDSPIVSTSDKLSKCESLGRQSFGELPCGLSACELTCGQQVAEPLRDLRDHGYPKMNFLALLLWTTMLRTVNMRQAWRTVQARTYLRTHELWIEDMLSVSLEYAWGS